MKFFGLLLPAFIITMAFGCEREQSRKLTVERSDAVAFVIAASLDDSIPPKELMKLGLENKVLGTKIKFPTGNSVSYFAYTADADDVISMLARLPFSKYATAADSLSHKIDFVKLEFLKRTLTATEVDNATAFWNANPADFEVYECLKSPVMHTVLINRKTNQILHRVAS